MRIIVYGDSNIQARFSNLRDTFPYKLEEYLEVDLKKNIEVLNAGVIGFGPDQSLIRFAREADIYHPDIVVFHIFADNDFGDIIRNRLFELDSAGNLVKTGHKKMVDRFLTEKRGIGNFTSRLLSLRAIGKVTRLVKGKEKITKAEVIQHYLSTRKKEYAVYRQSQVRYFSHFEDHYDMDIALFPNAESSKTKIKLMEGVLREAKAIATSKGVELLVLIQPSAMDLTTNVVISYKDFSAYQDYQRTNLTAAVENMCILNSIHRVNLFDIFLENDPETLFFKITDDHWNNVGQNLAAKETASYISNFISKTGSIVNGE